MGQTIIADVINTLADIAAESPLAELRRRREAVMQHTQGSYDALFAPADPAGLSLEERAMAALRVAVLTNSTTFRDHYRQLLAQLGVTEPQLTAVANTPDTDVFPARTVALLRHVDMMTIEPRTATKAHIGELESHGFSARDIVTLAQLVTFVTFQVRVLAGLKLMGEGQ